MNHLKARCIRAFLWSNFPEDKNVWHNECNLRLKFFHVLPIKSYGAI